MEYVRLDPLQTTVEPVMEPGCAGILVGVTARVSAGLLPQELFAVTRMLPEVLLAVGVISVLVEVPVHPEGKVQV